tara:strand:- start:545 stop:1216 length:672 start_codon:yes stop_codon:yes gene_type:complete
MNQLFYLGLSDGIQMALITIITSLLLDLTSIFYLIELFKKPYGITLYLNSLVLNFVNSFFIGSLSYGVVTYYVITQKTTELNMMIFEIFSILLIQSIGYYLMHMIMHTKNFYWMHKFHHNYSSIVIPSSANAVTIYEYMFAYMLPIIIGIIMVRPCLESLYYAVKIISLFNLLIHTPWLNKISKYLVPDIFVSTNKHIEHHQKLNKNYAAPTLNIDKIISIFD